MSKIHPNTPIIVGVGQMVVHWDGNDVSAAPSPLGLQVDAARKALQDSGKADKLSKLIDAVVVVRSMLDSIDGSKQPFGRCTNPPASLANLRGLELRLVGASDRNTVASNAPRVSELRNAVFFMNRAP